MLTREKTLQYTRVHLSFQYYVEMKENDIVLCFILRDTILRLFNVCAICSINWCLVYYVVVYVTNIMSGDVVLYLGIKK